MITNAGGYTALNTLFGIAVVSMSLSFSIYGLISMWTTKEQEIVHTDHLDICYERTRQGGIAGTVAKVGYFHQSGGPFGRCMHRIQYKK